MQPILSQVVPPAVVVMVRLRVPVGQHGDVDRRLAGADQLGAAGPLDPHPALSPQHEPARAIGGAHVLAYVGPGAISDQHGSHQPRSPPSARSQPTPSQMITV